VLQRLIGTLERLLRAGQQTAAERKAGEFNEILAEVLIGLRQGESFDLAALKVKARLTQSYPGLAVLPALLPQRDALKSVQCFGLTFKSRHTLSATDRRFLKATAQILHSAAEWQAARSEDRRTLSAY